MHTRMRAHPCIRARCVRWLDAAWGVAMCRIVVSYTPFALLLAVNLCFVDRCFDSWVLLGLFCLLRAAHTTVPQAVGMWNLSPHAADVVQVSVVFVGCFITAVHG